MRPEQPQMNCEEMAALGFDFDGRAAEVNESQRAAAEEHLRACGSCAAQFESWRELRGGLRALAEETRRAQAPSRVETELRRKVLRLGYERRWERRRAAIAGWALAAAAVAAVAMGVRHWMWPGTPVAVGPAVKAPAAPELEQGTGKQNVAAVEQPNGPDAPVRVKRTTRPADSAAEAGQDEFTLLPGGLPIAAEDASILRVRMQRGALGALGLPVNEERSGEWVLVDLVVSADGQPQAVRPAR